jgi:hypothetical protein
MEDKIHIEVVDIKEEENGSAILSIEMNEPAREFLIQEGILSILRNKISNMEGFQDEKDTCCGTCGTDVGHQC